MEVLEYASLLVICSVSGIVSYFIWGMFPMSGWLVAIVWILIEWGENRSYKKYFSEAMNVARELEDALRKEQNQHQLDKEKWQQEQEATHAQDKEDMI